MAKTMQEMTNEEFFAFFSMELMKGWMPLDTYMRLYPEEKRNAIQIRIKRKVWTRGVHYAVPEGSRTWVNAIAIRQWVAGDTPAAWVTGEVAPP